VHLLPNLLFRPCRHFTNYKPGAIHISGFFKKFFGSSFKIRHRTFLELLLELLDLLLQRVEARGQVFRLAAKAAREVRQNPGISLPGRPAARAGDACQPPPPLGHPFFCYDLEEARLARPVQMSAAAEFTAKPISDLHHSHHVSILVPEECPHAWQMSG